MPEIAKPAFAEFVGQQNALTCFRRYILANRHARAQFVGAEVECILASAIEAGCRPICVSSPENQIDVIGEGDFDAPAFDNLQHDFTISTA